MEAQTQTADLKPNIKYVTDNFKYRQLRIFRSWATCKKPTAHSGTFGFADTQSQRKKPKEPEFLPTLYRKLINWQRKN